MKSRLSLLLTVSLICATFANPFQTSLLAAEAGAESRDKIQQDGKVKGQVPNPGCCKCPKPKSRDKTAKGETASAEDEGSVVLEPENKGRIGGVVPNPQPAPCCKCHKNLLEKIFDNTLGKIVR